MSLAWLALRSRVHPFWFFGPSSFPLSDDRTFVAALLPLDASTHWADAAEYIICGR